MTERAICADRIVGRRPTLFDMEVIVRRQDQEHCASITCMIRHYVARRAQVTEGHPHSAADRVGLRCLVLDTVLGAGNMSGPDAEMRPRAGWVRPPASKELTAHVTTARFGYGAPENNRNHTGQSKPG